MSLVEMMLTLTLQLPAICYEEIRIKWVIKYATKPNK